MPRAKKSFECSNTISGKERKKGGREEGGEVFTIAPPGEEGGKRKERVSWGSPTSPLDQKKKRGEKFYPQDGEGKKRPHRLWVSRGKNISGEENMLADRPFWGGRGRRGKGHILCGKKRVRGFRLFRRRGKKKRGVFSVLKGGKEENSDCPDGAPKIGLSVQENKGKKKRGGGGVYSDKTCLLEEREKKNRTFTLIVEHKRGGIPAGPGNGTRPPSGRKEGGKKGKRELVFMNVRGGKEEYHAAKTIPAKRKLTWKRRGGKKRREDVVSFFSRREKERRKKEKMDRRRSTGR